MYAAQQTLNLFSKNKVKQSKINAAVLGFSFKENILDIRNTKVINIIKQLQKKKVHVRVFDTTASKI